MTLQRCGAIAISFGLKPPRARPEARTRADDPKLWAAAERKKNNGCRPVRQSCCKSRSIIEGAKIAGSAVWTILNKNAPNQFDNSLMGKAMPSSDGGGRQGKAINTALGP